jgi:uncharacterized membrane protein
MSEVEILPIQTGRLLGFSDSVFAFVATLLVLEVNAPDSLHTKEGKLLEWLLQQWPEYVSYCVSFLVIGILWSYHHFMLRYVHKIDHTFMIINTFYLMFVAFVPFPTEVVSEYLRFNVDGKTAVMIYSGTMTIIASLSTILWAYASYKKRLISVSIDDKQIKNISITNISGVFLFLLSFLFAFWDVYISLLVYALVIMLYAFPHFGSALKRPIPANEQG